MRAIERRSYLRVNDQVHITHRVVSEEQEKHEPLERLLNLGSNFGLRKQLYKLELEARELRREISENDRKLGSYFHNLNQRFEMITDIVTGGDKPEPNLINLSPAGAAYTSRELFAANDLLALKITFKLSSLAVACFGRVRYSLLGEDDEYRIGVQFTSLDQTDEALLARHISSLQAEERRQRLHNPGNQP